jgi:mannose-1-phosphate guanylyltransferase
VEDPSAFGLVKTAPRGEVRDFLEKPEPGTAIDNPLINAGAYVLEHDVLDRIPACRAVSFERETFPSLVDDGLFGFEVNGYWLDIGTPERYLRATGDILSGTVKTAVGEALAQVRIGIGDGCVVEERVELRAPVLMGDRCEVVGQARVGPQVVLGDDCRVASDVTLERAVLFDGAEVEQGAVVRDSIVGAGARVQSGARVEAETIVGDGAVVREGARLRGDRVVAVSVPSGTAGRR